MYNVLKLLSQYVVLEIPTKRNCFCSDHIKKLPNLARTLFPRIVIIANVMCVRNIVLNKAVFSFIRTNRLFMFRLF